MEGGETDVLEEAGCRPDKRDQKLQSNSADIGDVKVVRIVYPLALGKGKRDRKVEESACWWSSRDELQTLASNGDELATKTLGMAGRKESCDETRNGGKTDDVLASLDIKTAFDEAKPKHVAKIMDNHNTH